MKKIFHLVALLLCLSNNVLAYFQTNTKQNVLGFVPVAVDLSDYSEKLNLQEDLDIAYFNNFLSNKLTLVQVECEGAKSLATYKTLYKELLLNILHHIRWQTLVGLKLRQGQNHPKGADENSLSAVTQLFSEEGLESANHDLIDKSQCTRISNAYLSVSQVNGIKQIIDARISKTFFDWLKENQTYLQLAWQGLVWGSALTEWYFESSALIPHLVANAGTYLRTFFSVAPIAFKLYYSYSKPLNGDELSGVAQRLQTMAAIRVRFVDGAKLEESITPSAIEVFSLRAPPMGMVYERYLLLKKLLLVLVETNPPISDDDFRASDYPRAPWPNAQYPVSNETPPNYGYDYSDEQRYVSQPRQTYGAPPYPRDFNQR